MNRKTILRRRFVLWRSASNNQKIYKNGTTCRSGAGGLPALKVGAMSFIYDSKYFDPLIEKVPQEVLDQPINYEEPTPNGSLEYIIAFFGISKNGDTGERADWSKSTGIRVKIDHQSGFNHPIMGLLDGLTMEAAELTNNWYFDVVMLSRWKVKSSTLPEETIITQPKTEKETDEDVAKCQHNRLIDRKWRNLIMPMNCYDSLEFINNEEVVLYNCELAGSIFEVEVIYLLNCAFTPLWVVCGRFSCFNRAITT